MSLFDKFFGKKPQPTEPAPAPAAPPAPAPSPSTAEADKPPFIKIFDGQGRELMVPRDEWRDKVLMSGLQDAWNNADELGPMIVQALRNEFYTEVIGAAEQVQKIDPIPARGTVLLGLVYLKNERYADAEEVLKDCLEKHGDHGVVLTNLAKVYAAQGDDAKAEATLWRGLEVDPNQDNGAAMYEHLQSQRGGEEAGLEAVRRIAALPGSWRAQLALARLALKAGQLEQAQALQQESLARCGRPVPPEVLMQISGDLGLQGHLVELVQVTEPLFQPAIHGLQVGNNLFRAYLDLGQIEQARNLVEQLHAQRRPDWKQSLAAWETQIAQAGVDTSSLDGQKSVRVAILNIEGPVWLNSSAPGAELFETKEDFSLRIAFLGSSGDTGNPSAEIQAQMPDAAGRLSRMIPLYLTEQVHLGTVERAQTLIPWISEKEGAGFVFAGSAWEDETAVQIAGANEHKPDYIITTHLLAKEPVWTLELHLVRVIDGNRLGTQRVNFTPDAVHEVLPRLSRELLDLLAEQAEAELQALPTAYQPPTGEALSFDLLRLEQLLAIRCAATDGTPAGFLSGEREILDGNLRLCLASPTSPTLRLLLAQTLLTMRKVRPDILPEFKAQVALLQNEQPLPPPAHGVVQRMIDEAFRS